MLSSILPYSAGNNLIRNECVLLPARPEHHGSKGEILGEIQSYIHRYVELSPVFERVAAHYVLLSWVYDAFNELPYLRLRGDFGSGKTRGLITIGSIMYKPFFSSGASTVSPLFHILDTFGGSLILDEADYRFTDASSELVKILNATTKGLPVLRTMQNRHRELNPRAFRVFGPKLVAMRSWFADQGLESRLVSEDMTERRMRGDIPIHLPDSLRAEALSLRNRLLHYRFCALFTTRINPDRVSREDNPRLNQMMLPLLSLVDEPDLQVEIRELVLRHSDRLLRDDHAKLLAETTAGVISNLFERPEVKFVSIGKITQYVNDAIKARYTAKEIGVVIRESLGIETRKSHGVYVVERTMLHKSTIRHAFPVTRAANELH